MIIECSKCLMNSNIKEIFFNQDQICNFCLDHKKFYKCFTELEINKNLQSLTNKISKKNIKSSYDCIVGLSGGCDSSYVIYLLYKMKLKPLIIHLDNGWNTSLAYSNIDKILEKTKFDYKTIILDWSEFRDLQRSFLKSGVPDIEILTDHAILASIIKVAKNENIKYIISGVNFATEHAVIPSWGWRKDDFFHIKSIQKKFGTLKIKNFPKMYPYTKFLNEKILKQIEFINILDFINYNTVEAKKDLKKEFDWNDYIYKHHESFFTMFFEKYILRKKFQIDKRILHFSNLIRNKEMTKHQAEILIKNEDLSNDNIKALNDIKYFKKKLILNDKEYEEIMNSTPNEHSNYSMDIYSGPLFNLIKKTLNFIFK